MNIFQDGKAGRSVLLYAVEYNRSSMVQYLLEHGATPDLQNYASKFVIFMPSTLRRGHSDFALVRTSVSLSENEKKSWQKLGHPCPMDTFLVNCWIWRKGEIVIYIYDNWQKSFCCHVDVQRLHLDVNIYFQTVFMRICVQINVQCRIQRLHGWNNF